MVFRGITRMSWIACVLVFLAAGCGSVPGSFNTPAPTIILSPTSLPTPSSLPSPTTVPAPAGAPSLTVVPRTPTPGPAAATVDRSNSTDWTTYHRDNTRTGYVPDMPDPQRLAVAWSTALDGAVYAEPLVVGGHVLVATEAYYHVVKSFLNGRSIDARA